jgi:hypothetical protein
MSRRSVVDISGLSTPAMSLATAIELLPTDKSAFNKARFWWINVVRGLQLLTTAQRQVGLVIAQDYINTIPENPWFHSAWPAHQTIAGKTGLTRRTVVSAMVTLNQLGLIAVEHGGGLKVAGGRTDRFTLRTDRLDVLEQAAQSARQKDVKSFHGSIYQADRKMGQSREKASESGEIDDQMIRNSPSEDVKGLRTTPSNIIPLGGLSTTLIGSPLSATESVATQRPSNGRKEHSEPVTAQDHLDLAALLGEGNIEKGYCRLCDLDEADANNLALRYRLDRSSGEAVRAEAARLEAILGRSG